MIKRILLLLISKMKSIFLSSIAFSARVEHSSVSRKAKVMRGCVLNNSNINDYTYISPNTRVIHANIGKFCSIASECCIGMGTHATEFKSTSPIFYSVENPLGKVWTNETFYKEHKTVNIGNDVWIGQRVMIMGGISIGNGAIVGAGAVVTKDVPPYSIIGGVPGHIIKYRFSDKTIKELEDSEWWNKDDEYLKKHIKDFQTRIL